MNHTSTVGRPKIEDGLTNLAGKVSRARIHQLRKQAKGLCIICTRKSKGGRYCPTHEKHYKKLRAARYQRQKSAKLGE